MIYTKSLSRHGPSPASAWAKDFAELRSIMARVRTARPDVRPHHVRLLRGSFEIIERDLRERPSPPILDRWVRSEVEKLRAELDELLAGAP